MTVVPCPLWRPARTSVVPARGTARRSPRPTAVFPGPRARVPVLRRPPARVAIFPGPRARASLGFRRETVAGTPSWATEPIPSKPGAVIWSRPLGSVVTDCARARPMLIDRRASPRTFAGALPAAEPARAGRPARSPRPSSAPRLARSSGSGEPARPPGASLLRELSRPSEAPRPGPSEPVPLGGSHTVAAVGLVASARVIAAAGPTAPRPATRVMSVPVSHVASRPRGATAVPPSCPR